ncbi:MAG: polysaccharide deacetylase family protein [Candidatus Omnitrophota bacterium]
MRKLFVIGLVLLLLIGGGVWYKPFYTVPILNYHSVNAPGVNEDTPKVSPEMFERQMDFINRLGYRVISIKEYIEGRQQGKKLNNCIVITFDDGYEDNYTFAFPVLSRYGFPATVFLIAKEVDTPRFLKLWQIRKMYRQRISFGAHSFSHLYLPAVKEEKVLRREISGAKRFLEKKLGFPVEFLAYPTGGFNERVELLAKEAGYNAAFTTNRGKGKFNRDPFALKRIKITQNSRPGIILWFKLSGYYQLFQKNRKPY